MTSAKGSDRRERILRAAFELIAERGYRATSIAAVADRVGLTPQGVMHYFPTKDQLLIGVLGARDQWDLLDIAHTADPSAIDATHMAALVEYNADRPRIVQAYTVLSAESVTEDHPARAHFQDRYARVRRVVAGMVERLDGELPAGLTPDRIATLAVAVLDGLQLQWLLDPDEVDMPDAFRDFLALLGIKA